MTLPSQERIQQPELQEANKDPPPEPSEAAQLCQGFDFGHLASRAGRKEVSVVLRHPVVMTAPGEESTGHHSTTIIPGGTVLRTHRASTTIFQAPGSVLGTLQGGQQLHELCPFNR